MPGFLTTSDGYLFEVEALAVIADDAPAGGAGNSAE
jgi:hypothetical protein